MLYLLDCARKYGDFVAFRAGPVQAFFLNDPSSIQYILLDNYRNYTKQTIQYRSLATITGNGLLTSDGAFWLSQRRLAQPAFSRTRLQSLGPLVEQAGQAMLSRWGALDRREATLDIDREMMQVTLEVVGKALFSVDLSREAHQLTGAVLTVLDHIIARARLGGGLPASWPTPANLRFRKALKTLDTTIYAIIEERSRDRQELPEDLLTMLLKARDPATGQGMGLRQLRDEMITLLIAGHETVASALTWTWYLLANHPDARERLNDELDQILDGRSPTLEDLPSLRFTRAVFDEALRLYPPAWLITRQSIETDRIQGYQIPPRSLIILSPYTIHRHPEYWVEPDRFDPDRFTAENANKTPRYAYIPFGGGPRLCIGNQFALLEGQLLLAMIAQRFRLDLAPGQEVVPEALVTIRPRNGLPLRTTVRQTLKQT